MYDATFYVTPLALLHHVSWPRMRLMGVSMAGGVVAAFIAAFPDLADNEVVLSSDLSRTAKVVSPPIAYRRRLASKPDHGHTIEDALVHELVRLQSVHLPELNRAVSSSLRARGPSRASAGRLRAGHGRAEGGTADQTIPPSHSSQLKALLANSIGSQSNTKLAQPKQDAARVELALVPGAGHART
ncbi:hypothetical protein DFH09DRAFT_1326841 [Mycena vulgaris]|nr:hypothetical protein DFH09DRAFT_1326841 [Mycena vulgaris]